MMIASANGRVSPPYHLQVKANGFPGGLLSVREHFSPLFEPRPELPLVLVTFHPGYAAGSYTDRDYFELLVPLLFQSCHGCCRLHIFTVNHPGYDLPPGHKVDRFDLAPYALDAQPGLIEQVLRWLVLREYGDESQITLLAYGHSMGGLALARADLAGLETAVAAQGRRLRLQKVLSAPAMILRREARANLGRLTALDVVKRTVGRMPLYDRFAQSLFRNIAPLLWRRDAANYALNPHDSFLDFPRYNPYILLEQGRQLLCLDFDEEEMARMLGGTHLILSTADGMVDSETLAHAAEHARLDGTAVTMQYVDSSHNAEREHPELINAALCALLQQKAAPP